MTACVRRRARRCKQNDLSHILAALWGHRNTDLGSLAAHLLGQDRIREVVVVALLLEKISQGKLKTEYPP
jgi:hypothetical protein